MKKFIFLLLIGLMPLYSFAAIIITQNDERLEDVTIQSETDSTIVILQQGAEITLPISTIKGILYDNGTYKEISLPQQSISVEQQNHSQGNIKITTKEYKKPKEPREPIIKPIDWSNFNKEKLWMPGLITGGCGIGCILIGAICIGTAGPDDAYDVYNDAAAGVGTAFVTIGAISTACSVPLLIIGGKEKFKNNKKTNDTQVITLNLQVQKESIGLALNF